MKFLSDLPIVNNGIFVYDLEIKKDYSKYYKSLEYMGIDNSSSNMSIKRDVLNKVPEVKKEVKLACDHFINEILSMECDYHIYNSWATLTKPNCESSAHCHTNSWISGVYYPEYNKDFNIIFYNDFHNFYMTKIKKFGIYNSRFFTVNPKQKPINIIF
jgi:hypothetical protein